MRKRQENAEHVSADPYRRTRGGLSYGSSGGCAGRPVRLSYGEVTQRAAHLRRRHDRAGIRPGDRVAILSRNNFRYLEVNLACAYAGIILIPLNHRLAAKEIDGILARTETRLLFQALPFDAKGVSAVTWDDNDPPGAANGYEAMIASGNPLARAHDAKLDDIAQIYFTSGTTGEPKGACLDPPQSHRHGIRHRGVARTHRR